MLKRILFASLFVSVLFASCKKKKDEEANPSDSNEGGKKEYFIKASIGGNSKSWIDDNSGNFTQGYSSNGFIGNGDNVLYSAFYYSTGISDYDASEWLDVGELETDTLFLPMEEGNVPPSQPSEDQFAAHFTTGAKAYASKSAGTDGYSFIWYDENGDLWSSKLGSQSGSTFTITSVEASEELYLGYIVTAKGTFSCKIYDEYGNSKNVTDGSFRINFLKN